MTYSCLGSGLISLDIISNRSKSQLNENAIAEVGGSCGNVLLILAHLGWLTAPIVRLGKDKPSDHIVQIFKSHNADMDHCSQEPGDAAPLIMHYLKNDGRGGHKFDFYNPRTQKMLPRFKPVTKVGMTSAISTKRKYDALYCDRITPANILLAESARGKSTLVFLEPPSAKPNDLAKILPFVDILKVSQGRLPGIDAIRSPSAERTLLLIETLGSDGLRFRRASHKKQQPSWQTVSAIGGIAAVDTAGAGDWTTACLLHYGFHGLAKADDTQVKKALQRARIWGALATLFMGARGAMRHMDRHALHAICGGERDAPEGLSDKSGVPKPPSPTPQSAQRLVDLLRALGV